METLYRQSSGSLSLKSEYQAALISLCSTILEYFVSAFKMWGILFERELDSLVKLNVREREDLMGRIREMDRGCQGFKVVVDVDVDDDIESEEGEVEDVSDDSDSWDLVSRVNSAEGGVGAGV